jgi:hypothetical protein
MVMRIPLILFIVKGVKDQYSANTIISKRQGILHTFLSK